MTPDRAQILDAVIGQVRLAFHRLKALGDRLHRGAGVTAAMRGVLESLADGGPQSVPQLARARPVARQHIQVIVDALGAAGLVAFHDNPAHKRSPLVELTDKGRDLFQDMRRREAAILREIVKDIPEQHLTVTMRTLGAVIERLSVLARAHATDDEGET